MTTARSLSLTRPGEFVVGCNYWASHAGTRTWSDWQPAVVEQDFQQLSAAGLQVLRVFPLWPDFQPLTAHYSSNNHIIELRQGEDPFPDTEAGRAGVSETALQHFNELADLAQKYNLKLIVGLVTGWMSGRLFVPPAFQGLNVLTDPTAIMWQVRYVRCFVRHFKEHPAVLAWDLGNECNCMTQVPSRQAAWVWTSSITHAIRVEDPSRPVVSGMHSLTPEIEDIWTMQDQGELTDLLTTHPYPYFTPHADQDPINTIRTILHSTSESRYYGDIGAKPCLAEELGTLGPNLASDAVAADFIRSCLFSLWAHDCHGLLWWCAFDQLHLTHTPYDWNAVERELGLFRIDRTAKPVLSEFTKFRAFLDQLPIEALPPRQVDAVCILTSHQDTWAAAYSSFILAKQAGFDLEFQYSDQPLKPAPLYLIPSASGDAPLSRHLWFDLLEKVKAGATLYLSHDNCLVSPFNQPFGLTVQSRQRRSSPAEFSFDTSEGEKLTLRLDSPIRFNIQADTASILGREVDGNPAFTCNAYGKGKIYFLSLPIETGLAHLPGSFHTPSALPFWKIYCQIAEEILTRRVVTRDNPLVGLSEHPIDDDTRVVIAINYSPSPQSCLLSFASGWRLKEYWRGEASTAIAPNDAAVFVVSKG
jgi:hypothetical protein